MDSDVKYGLGMAAILALAVFICYGLATAGEPSAHWLWHTVLGVL